MSLPLHVRPSVENLGGKCSLVCRYQLCWGEGEMDLSVRRVILLYVTREQHLKGFC